METFLFRLPGRKLVLMLSLAMENAQTILEGSESNVKQYVFPNNWEAYFTQSFLKKSLRSACSQSNASLLSRRDRESRENLHLSLKKPNAKDLLHFGFFQNFVSCLYLCSKFNGSTFFYGTLSLGNKFFCFFVSEGWYRFDCYGHCVWIVHKVTAIILRFQNHQPYFLLTFCLNTAI